MQNYRVVLIVGVIEIVIGLSTLLSNTAALISGQNLKSSNILLFVLAAACVSTSLGIGLLRFKRLAYQLLLYFSTVVIFSKLMAFLGVIQFNGQIEVTLHEVFNVPLPEWLRKFMTNLKQIISIAYHAFILYFFTKPGVKGIFHK